MLLAGFCNMWRSETEMVRLKTNKFIMFMHENSKNRCIAYNVILFIFLFHSHYIQAWYNFCKVDILQTTPVDPHLLNYEKPIDLCTENIQFLLFHDKFVAGRSIYCERWIYFVKSILQIICNRSDHCCRCCHGRLHLLIRSLMMYRMTFRNVNLIYRFHSSVIHPTSFLVETSWFRFWWSSVFSSSIQLNFSWILMPDNGV